MKGILCFGDSITFGRGEIPNKGWVGRLKEYFEAKESYNCVYNLGVPGHTSTDILQRFDTEAKGRIQIIRSCDQYRVLIAIGLNDIKSKNIKGEKRTQIKTSTQQFEKNISELITKATQYQAKIVFVGLIPIHELRTQPFETSYYELEQVKKYDEIIKNVCEKNNILFCDMFTSMAQEKYSLLLEDGLHPNNKGYDFMFEKIKLFLEKNKLL